VADRNQNSTVISDPLAPPYVAKPNFVPQICGSNRLAKRAGLMLESKITVLIFIAGTAAVAVMLAYQLFRTFWV
jgi:hypothetical protein